MPFSSESGKTAIKWVVSKLPKKDRMLDIGAGCGTYAKMFPAKHWTGVEVWEPYVEKYGLKNLYNDLIVKDATELEFNEHYDVAFAGDVLEHMSSEEAIKLIKKLKACADTVIISIPIGHYPQGPYEDNPYEIHIVDNWTDEAVKEAFGVPTFSRIDSEIGVYVYSKFDIRLKIAVYAISKNEEQFVQRFAEASKDADLIMVADTGSTDGTVEACQRAGIAVHNICITPWRFDHARNAALALLPKDIDICISLDLDEILEPGWREEIERVWEPGTTTRLEYLFDWGQGIRFRYQKIHARHGYFWHHPCHEYPVHDKRITEVWAYTDMLLVSHHPDPTKSRGQYLDLLELSVKEDPSCPRNAFYYARELTFYAKWHEAIAALHKYLGLPGSTWANERCYAMRLLGKAYDHIGNAHDAAAWYRRACAEAPNTREPWCDLAMFLYRRHEWPECYGASMKAISIKDKQLVYTCDPAVWGHWPHDLAAIAAWNMGMKEEAVRHAKHAVDLSPNDQRLIANLTMMEQVLYTPVEVLEAAE